MGERGRLGRLEVGEAGHHGLDVRGRGPEQDAPERAGLAGEREELVAEAEAEAGRDLVVPGAPDVEPAAGLVADRGREVGLDPGVDVLVRGVVDGGGKAAVAEGEEAAEEGPDVGRLDDPLPAEHQHVREVHEQVRLADIPVGPGRRQQPGDIPRPLSLEASAPHHVPYHAVPIEIGTHCHEGVGDAGSPCTDRPRSAGRERGMRPGRISGIYYTIVESRS